MSSHSSFDKANMMLLSKEMTDKDRSLKTQLLIRTENNSDEKVSGEKVWQNDGFFDDIKPDLNLEKKNMPENTLYYVNQGYLSTVKNGDLAMYNHNFILGQLIVAANQPSDVSSYECSSDEVKLLTCIYDNETGEFQGVREKIAFIVLRGDENDIFFSYGFDSSKEKILYSTSKQKIPDAFVSTSFKKHYHEVLNEKRESENQSQLFYYLPSITDRKESINKWLGNVNLTPVDFNLEFIESFSTAKQKFQPNLLNSSDPSKRNPQVDLLRNFFRHLASYSNQNLTRNVDCLLLKEKKMLKKWNGVSVQQKNMTFQNSNLLIRFRKRCLKNDIDSRNLA